MCKHMVLTLSTSKKYLGEMTSLFTVSGYSKKVAIYKPGRVPLTRTKLVVTLILDL